MFTNLQWILLISLISVCAILILAFVKFQQHKDTLEQKREQKIIEKGKRDLESLLLKDGSINPVPFTIPPETFHFIENDGNKKPQKKSEDGIVTKVVDNLQNGKLLRTINKFFVNGEKIKSKLEEKLSPKEGKEEREKLARLANDAVNPLFEIHMNKLLKEKELEESKKTTAQHMVNAFSSESCHPNNEPNKATFETKLSDEQKKALEEAMSPMTTAS